MTDPTDPPEPGDDGTYGLVMPFVICEDQGGPFDGSGFVAGYVCGTLDKTLEALAASFHTTAGTATVQQYVDPRVIPQLDLIAMHHGFTIEHEPWDEHPDEWTLVTLTRQEPTDARG